MVVNSSDEVAELKLAFEAAADHVTMHALIAESHGDQRPSERLSPSHLSSQRARQQQWLQQRDSDNDVGLTNCKLWSMGIT